MGMGVPCSFSFWRGNGCPAFTSTSRSVRSRLYEVVGCLGKTALVVFPRCRKRKCFFIMPGILAVAREKGTVQEDGVLLFFRAWFVLK